MSTEYFILSKSPDTPTNNNRSNQIIYLNERLNFILPHVNMDYYTRNGLFENRLIEWCKQFCSPTKLFLDIGAHTGTYSITFAKLCKEVHAFEPQKMTYYGLCGGIALSNITNICAHNLGLGSPEQVGKQTLHIVSNDGGGSSLHEDVGEIMRKEYINVVTLDSLELNDVGFIKMDVEDKELSVLQGGKETILRSGCPRIVFESNGKGRDELFQYLQNTFGYKVIPVGGMPNMFLAALQ